MILEYYICVCIYLYIYIYMYLYYIHLHIWVNDDLTEPYVGRVRKFPEFSLGRRNWNIIPFNDSPPDIE